MDRGIGVMEKADRKARATDRTVKETDRKAKATERRVKVTDRNQSDG